MARATARSLALKLLLKVEKSQAFPDVVLGRDLARSGLNERDRRLATELTYGVIRHRLKLDWVIDSFLKSKKKLDTRVRNVLRVALYQIFFLDRVPDRAAVDEAVKMAGWAKPLVNGLLRSVLRERESIPWPDPEKEPALSIAVEYSHPVWLVERWLNEFGPEDTEKLLSADNLAPELHLRANTLKTGRDSLVALLNREGFSAGRGPYVPEALVLKPPGRPPDELPGFKEGLFQVQDTGSQAVAHLVAPEKGSRALDLCAGFGTKALHLAQLMGGEGRIVALDMFGWKLEALEREALRLGVEGIETVTADLLEYEPEEPFHLVLLDAPCTGLGTLRRNPDIKWRAGRKDVRRLSNLQRELLARAASFVAPGGALVYSVCTLTDDETVGVVSNFLKENDAFSVEPASGVLLPSALPLAREDGFLHALPHRHGTDGFFAARLRYAKYGL